MGSGQVGTGGALCGFEGRGRLTPIKHNMHLSSMAGSRQAAQASQA